MAPELPESIFLALQCISSHPAVNSTTSPKYSSGCWVIEFDIHVEMPRDAAEKGVTDTGVRELEPVRLVFGHSFPISAPLICLREDFNRELPHINPSKKGSYVYPCVTDLALDELIHEPSGIEELINRIVIWLNDAATGELMNPDQGWEPIRRDETKGGIECNSEHLIRHASRMGGPGAFYLPYEYYDEELWGYSGKLGRITAKTHQIKDVDKISEGFKIVKKQNISVNKSIALFIWAGKDVVIDRYLPDTVEDIDSLLNLAKEYKCKGVLSARLKELDSYFSGLPYKPGKLDLAVIFAVRRPYNLISQQTSYELICYSITLSMQRQGTDIFSATVEPVGQLDELSTQLLEKLSGREDSNSKSDSSVLLVGCGSLGSKIGTHLARAGFNNLKLIDKGIFRPHNNARHSLIWNRDITFPKSILLSLNLEELGGKAKPILSSLIEDLASRPKATLKNVDVIIDTTASSEVREAFANVADKYLSGVYIRTEIYSQGMASVLSIEGENRNPRIDDIYAQLYTISLHESSFRGYMYQSNTMSRVSVGQSCGSYTMKMTDAELSIHASMLADITQKNIDSGLPQGGGLWVLSKCTTTFSIDVKFYEPWKFVSLNSSSLRSSWKVRVSEGVLQEMSEKTAQSAPKEAGGALIGHISWARRVVHITELVDPPIDSVASETQFILGVDGLRAKLLDIERGTGGTITYIGTWHSHPRGGGPSETDIDTLRDLSEQRGFVPTVCLICTENEIIAV